MVKKLKITFRGEVLGELVPGKVSMDEAQQLEDKTGLTYNEMVIGVDKSSSKATRALVWFMRLRKGQEADLWEKFTFGDVDVEVIDEADPTKPANTAGESSASETVA